MAIDEFSVIPNSITSPDTFDTDMDQFLSEMNPIIEQMNATSGGMTAVAAGTALAIPLMFSTTTTDSDPGNGKVRLNNSTQNLATVIRTDLIGSDGSTWTDVLNLFDDSTSTIKGYITLKKLTDATKYLVFSVTALANPSGYMNITVACVAYSAANPFALNDDLILEFTRNGDKGDTGTTGTFMPIATSVGGTVNAITATYAEVLSLTDNLYVTWKSSGPNDVTNPTINVDGLGALTLKKRGGQALAYGDTGASGTALIARYTSTGTYWELVNPQSDATLGGTSTSGSVALGTSSTYVQKVTPTGYGQSCTVAVATAYAKGAVHSIYNASDYDLAFIDATGVTRGFIPPWATVDVSLVDNSTSAGGWVLSGAKLLGVTAQTFWTGSTGGPDSNAKMQAIPLDSDRTLFLFGNTSCYTRVHRKSTGVWTGPALVRSSVGAGAFIGILSATNQVLVVTCSSTTAMQACTLTINASTDAVTVNGSPGTATLGGNWAKFGQLIAVGSAWVLSLARATTTLGLFPISVSGTTPTIGSETAVSTANSFAAHIYAVSSSVVLALSVDNTAVNFRATPYTVSGSSALSAGTTATTPVTAGSGVNAFRSMAVGTRWHAYVTDTTLKGAVVSVSGTVATISTASLSAVVTADVSTNLDALLISSTKSAVMSTNGAANLYFNILAHDGSGNASVGSEISVDTSTVSASAVAAISAASNVAKFTAVNTRGNTLYTVDCSGATPSITDIFQSGGGSASPVPAGAIASNPVGCTRSAFNLASTAGVLTVAPPNTTNPLGGYAYGAKLTILPVVPIPAFTAGAIVTGSAAVPYSIGNSSAESWFYYCGPTGGINQITKVEAAQP